MTNPPSVNNNTSFHFFFIFIWEIEKIAACKVKRHPLTVTRQDPVTSMNAPSLPSSSFDTFILVSVIHPFSKPLILFRVVKGWNLTKSSRDTEVRLPVDHRAQCKTTTLN